MPCGKCGPLAADFGKSTFADELQRHPELEVGFVTATPRMARYLEYSTQIYNIYLKYIAPEDIHVYSIDEVFLDVTQYLKTYGMTARELASRIATEILEKRADRHSRNWNQSVPVQDCHGYCSKAYGTG